MSQTTRTPILNYFPGGGVPVGKPTEVIGDFSGVQVLTVGRNYVDVNFSPELNNADWQFVELRIVNIGDLNPLNIFPGLVTNKSASGFRVWLNGNPDTANYRLYWTVHGVPSRTDLATYYNLTGPTTCTFDAPSTFTVSLPEGQAVELPVTVIPDDDGAGGTFSPTSVELSTDLPTAGFTYTPAAYGSLIISTINNGMLSDPLPITLNVIVDTYFLSGPGSGENLVASTAFTVALPTGGAVTGTVTVTPSDGSAGGTFTPISVGLTTAAPSATFTYTPASTGAKTISVTNDADLTDPSSLTYTSNAPSPHLLQNLISYWKLDETSGSTLADAHGSNPLTYNAGTTSPFAAIINNGQYFSGGANAGHASNADLQVTGSFFFSFWARMDDNAVNQVIINKDDYSSNRDYLIFYNGASGTGFGFIVNGGASSISKGANETAFSWHNVVCWYDASDQKLRMRIDDATTYTAAAAGSLVQTAQPFSIGGFTGLLDEIGFWKGRIPTATEITALYNGGAGLPYGSFTS
jgi:hypothetical protein